MEVKGAGSLPAPNAYDKEAKNVVMKKQPSYGFGVSKRQEIDLGKGMPGPGAYVSKTIVGTETQGKSMAQRYSDPKTSNMLAPGPG